jgi:hypothetical protein
VADENKVSFIFDAADEKLQAVATRTEKMLKGLGSSVSTMSDRDFKAAFTGGSEGVNKYGEALEGVEKRHFSMRHAMALTAAATGGSSAQLMHLYYAMTMFGPAMGTAVAGILIFKEALDEHEKMVKEATKAQEEYLKVMERTNEITGYGAGAKGEYSGAYAGQIDSINEKLIEQRQIILDNSETIFSNINIFTLLFGDEKIEQANKMVEMYQKLQNQLIKVREEMKPLDVAQEHFLKAQFEHSIVYAGKGKETRESMSDELDIHKNKLEELKHAMSGLKEGGESYKKVLKEWRQEATAVSEQEEKIKESDRKWNEEYEQLKRNPNVNIDVNNRMAAIQLENLNKLKTEDARYYQEKIKWIDAGKYTQDVANRLEWDHMNRVGEIGKRTAEEKYQYEKSRRSQLQAYRNEEISAIKGQPIAALEALQQKKEEEFHDAMRKGDLEMAMAAQSAYEAKSGAMGLNAERELQGKNKVGFSGLSEMWKSIATSASGGTPAEREQIAALKELVALTREQTGHLKVQKKAHGTYGK